MSEKTVQENPGQSRFEVSVDGEPAGFAAYEVRDGAFALTHTEIDPRFEGQGLGSTLIKATLEDLRGRDAAVLPYCPFVTAYIQEHPEYGDLVPEGLRARFDLS